MLSNWGVETLGSVRRKKKKNTKREVLGSSLQHSYCDADRPGLRVVPAFVPINVLFLSLKEELNERKRLEEKA